MKPVKPVLIFFLIANLIYALEDVYLEPEAFIANSFASEPEIKTIWLKQSIKEDIKKLTGLDYPGLRIRYWEVENKRAWILEAIGKVKLITTGFLTNDQIIEDMRVLIYRETHGYEVQYPFFRNQFKGLRFESQNSYKLNKKIDGISGATLSVNALTKLSKIALYLDTLVAQSEN
jgi:hypothetical protein